MVLGGPQVGHGSQKLCLSMILQLHCQNRSGDYPKTVSQAISIWRANSLYVYVNWSYHLRFFFFFHPLNLYLLLHILLLLLLFLHLQLMENWEIPVILTVYLQLAPWLWTNYFNSFCPTSSSESWHYSSGCSLYLIYLNFLYTFF